MYAMRINVTVEVNRRCELSLLFLFAYLFVCRSVGWRGINSFYPFNWWVFKLKTHTFWIINLVRRTKWIRWMCKNLPLLMTSIISPVANVQYKNGLSKHKKAAKKENKQMAHSLALWLSLQNDSELWNFMEGNFLMRIMIDVHTLKHIIDSIFLIHIRKVEYLHESISIWFKSIFSVGFHFHLATLKHADKSEFNENFDGPLFNAFLYLLTSTRKMVVFFLFKISCLFNWCVILISQNHHHQHTKHRQTHTQHIHLVMLRDQLNAIFVECVTSLVICFLLFLVELNSSGCRWVCNTFQKRREREEREIAMWTTAGGV